MGKAWDLGMRGQWWSWQVVHVKGDGVPLLGGLGVEVGLPHIVNKLGPKGEGEVDGPLPCGVIIGNVVRGLLEEVSLSSFSWLK